MLMYSEIVWNTGAVGYLTHDVNTVVGSYGFISPDTTYGRTFAHAIMSIGMTNYDYNEVSSSYGSPSTEDPDGPWHARPSGYIFVNYYYSSYGRFISPSTSFFQISMVWVTSDGNTDSWGGVNYSYGKE